MASTYKRNDTYYAKFYDANQNPKQKRFSLKTTRKKIARRLLTDLERAYEAGEFSPWADGKKGDPFNYDAPDITPVALEELIDLFCQRKQSQGRSERTIENYKGVWNRFMERAGKGTLTPDLRPSTIASFCYETDVSQATRHMRFRHVRAIIRWGAANDYFDSNPVEKVDPPKEANKLPTPVRPDELRRIIDSIKKDYREKRAAERCRPRQIVWAIPVIRFAFYTGLRATEIGKLRWRDVDLEQETIFLREQKSGEQSYVPLIESAREVLQHVGTDRKPHGYVFNSPNGPEDRDPRFFAQRASRRFSKARKDAELDRNVTFHDLRGGFATQLASNGASAHVIKKALRHADLTMALKYIDVAGQTVKHEVEAAFS